MQSRQFTSLYLAFSSKLTFFLNSLKCKAMALSLSLLAKNTDHAKRIYQGSYGEYLSNH